MPSDTYFELSREQHDSCARATQLAGATLKVDYRRAMARLGRLLGLMDGFASCSWGCHGREHAIESLVGRSVSYARASLRLIEIGHYDEAIALTRTVAEIGNLCWLFFADGNTLREWIDAAEGKRRENFSPGQVRKRLEELNLPIPHDRNNYALLCELGIHPNPNINTQVHNSGGVPTLGGVFQESGMILCVSTLCWAVASVAGPAAKVGILERSRAERTVEIAIQLATPFDDTGVEVTGSSDAIVARAQARKQDQRPPAI